MYLIVSPQVKSNVATQTIIEGGNVVIDLSVAEAKDPFPPTTTSFWIFNGQNLSSSNGIILNDFNISLSDVQRNMSGNYSLTVTNSARSSTGSFELDVQCKIYCN